MLERIKPSLNIIPVKWLKPLDGYLKLNTNGCSKGNPGLAGGGGVLRDRKGDMSMTFSSFVYMFTNNMAEAKVILMGLK